MKIGVTRPASTPARRAKRRRSPADWLKIGFLLLALGFGSYYVASRWGQLSTVLGRMSVAYLCISMVAAVAGVFLGMLGWRTVLRDLDAPLSLGHAARVYFVGQLGKYLPGSVWSFLAQAQLAKEHDVSRKAVLAGSFLTLFVNVSGGLMVAAALLPFSSDAAIHHYWWIVFIVPALVALLHPGVAGRLIDVALRIIRRQPLEQHPSYGGMLRALGWFVLGWIVLGVHVWLLMRAISGGSGDALLVAIGGISLAMCLGVLFIPAPAGAGVRDVALVAALGSILPSTAALAIALVSRIILVVVDFILAAAGALWARRAGAVETDALAAAPPTR